MSKSTRATLVAVLLLAVAPGAITALVIAPLWTARWWVDFSRQPYTDILREGTTRAEQVSIDYYSEALWHGYSHRHLRPEVWQDPLVELSRWHWGVPESGTVAARVAWSLLFGGLGGGLVFAASMCWHLRTLRSMRADYSSAPAFRAALTSLAASTKPWFLFIAGVALLAGGVLAVAVYFRKSGPEEPPILQVTLGVVGLSYVLLPLMVTRCWRRVRNRLLPPDHAACERCLYPRSGLNSTVCPECGTRPPANPSSPSTTRLLPWRSTLVVGVAAFVFASALLQSWRFVLFAAHQRWQWYGTLRPLGAANGMLWLPFDRTLCVELEQPGHEPEHWYFRVASLGRLTHRITTLPDCSLLVAFPAEHGQQEFMVTAAHLDTGGTLDHRFRWLHVRSLVDVENDRRGAMVELRGLFSVTDMRVFDSDPDATDAVAGMLRAITPESLPHGEDALFSKPVALETVVPPRASSSKP
ncbi:MAG: hypothetical protein IT438_08000 [Phycisphaerales bacterium]|nr:hypothetical protein [Phycisphaerales bacterium]